MFLSELYYFILFYFWFFPIKLCSAFAHSLLFYSNFGHFLREKNKKTTQMIMKINWQNTIKIHWNTTFQLKYSVLFIECFD